MNEVESAPVDPPPAIVVLTLSYDYALLIHKGLVGDATDQVHTDGDEVGCSDAPLPPTTHRVSTAERLEVVSIGSSPPASPTPGLLHPVVLFRIRW